MTITTGLASAIAVVGIVLYVFCLRAAKTKVFHASQSIEFRLPAVTAGINLIHERRAYRRIDARMCLTFTEVSN
jgi:hypothetical protein